MISIALFEQQRTFFLIFCPTSAKQWLSKHAERMVQNNDAVELKPQLRLRFFSHSTVAREK